MTTPIDPDQRWRSFRCSHQDLIDTADAWPEAAQTPTAVADILGVSRSLFVHSWYAYDFLTVAAVHSLIGVEAALRQRLEERPKRRGPGMRNLVDRAVSSGLVAGTDGERLLAAVALRNAWLHVDGQKIITPGMAAGVLSGSHVAVARLFGSHDDRD